LFNKIKILFAILLTLSVTISITNLYGQESTNQMNIIDNKVNMTSTNNINNFINSSYTADKIYDEYKKKFLNMTIIEDKIGNSIDKDTLSTGNNVYVVWSDDTNRNKNSDILYKRSTDGGKTFERTIDLTDDVASSSLPDISSTGNNVYVAWSSDLKDISFLSSKDEGKTFGERKDIAHVEDIKNSLSDVRISSTGDNVYVFWMMIGHGDEIPKKYFVKGSTDGGETFGNIIPLMNHTFYSPAPYIATSGNNISVSWQDNVDVNKEDIFYKRSTDGGKTFHDTINLSNNIGRSQDPSMSSTGNNVYVVWSDDTNREFPNIFYKRSTDGGKTFENRIRLADDVSSYCPFISSTGNNVYVASAGLAYISFLSSKDEGKIFHNTNLLRAVDPDGDDRLEDCFPVDISSTGNNVYVMWNDYGNISVGSSNDAGETFGNTTIINSHQISLDSNDLPLDYYLPRDMIVSGNNVYVVWEAIESSHTNKDIFFRSSHDGGKTFGNTTNISNNPGRSILAEVAVS
jgi:hypothetical protein